MKYIVETPDEVEILDTEEEAIQAVRYVMNNGVSYEEIHVFKGEEVIIKVEVTLD